MSLITFFTCVIIVVGSINLIRITILMVGSDLYGLRQALAKKTPLTEQQLPTFSVVIPAHNEQETIIRALESVVNSDYPQDKLEIVVIDDGSTDATARLVTKQLENPNHSNVRLIEQTNAGKAHALNVAIEHNTTGDLVMCLDADSAIEPAALRNAARYFTDTRVVALSSNVKIINTGTILNLIQQFEYLVCYQMKRAHTFFNVEYIIGGIGSTFRRSALERVGYYDTDTITEDIDLTMKLIATGNKESRVIYGSDVVTFTEGVLSISDLIRQRFRWKHGRSQTFIKNASLFFSTNSRHNKFLTWGYLPYALVSDIFFFLEPLIVGFVIYVIIFYASWITLLSAFAVVGSYITLNVLAEDTLLWRQRLKMSLVAPFMYFFFYILSFVEYVALVQSYSKIVSLMRNRGTEGCSWSHVERVKRTGEV